MSYPCTGCNRYAFPFADVLCFWCQRRQGAIEKAAEKPPAMGTFTDPTQGRPWTPSEESTYFERPTPRPARRKPDGGEAPPSLF